MNRRNRNRLEGGFSLIEMLAVLTVLGVVAALVVPRVFVNKATTNKNACQTHCRHIEIQVQLWKRQHGAWPANDLSNMLPSSAPSQYDYFPDGLPVCPVDGSPYTIDATTREVVGHQH